MVLQAFYEGGEDFKESLCIAFSMNWGCLFGVLFCSFLVLLKYPLYNQSYGFSGSHVYM